MTDIKPDIKTTAGPLDLIKLGVAVLLLVFGVGEFYYYSTRPLVYGGVPHQVPAALRLLIMLAAIGVAVAVARFTGPGASAWRYLMSARGEVQRMVWPGRQQTIQATIAVIVIVIALGVFMWIIDLAVSAAVGGITGG